MERKKLPKLNLRGYCSQTLINSTIFATFTLLYIPLHTQPLHSTIFTTFTLCHNLASSMLKCDGSLT